MKKEISVALYGEEANYAVIRLPDRKNPGVVVQADSLAGLIEQLSSALGALDARDLDEAFAEIESIRDNFEALYKNIESELISHGENFV